MPDYLIWIKYISFFYYANDAVNIQLWQNYGSITCTLPNRDNNCANSLCFADGTQALESLEISAVIFQLIKYFFLN